MQHASSSIRAGIRLAFLLLLASLTTAHAGNLIQGGGRSSYVRSSTGGLKCFGDDDFGNCGDGVTGPARNTSADVLGLSTGVLQFSAGFKHACAVTTAGGVRCFGADDVGQIGDGTIGGGVPNDSIPTPVTPIGLASGVRAVGGGNLHTCAVMATGTVKCWGSNQLGQLGSGTIGTNNPTPTDVPGLTNAIAVAAGYYHTCVLTGTGGVKCWGNDQFGQLGDGTVGETVGPGAPNGRLTPADVQGLTSGVVAIEAGQVHTCALTDTGAMKCWGNDNRGQLGDATIGTPSNNPVPNTVSGLGSGVIGIAAHLGEFSCALKSDGTVSCWGFDNFGQLGDGTADPSRATPATVAGLSGIVDIATGELHACAIDGQGKVSCWGSSSDGQIGDGNTFGFLVYSATPKQDSGTYFSPTAGSGYTSSTLLPPPPAEAVAAGASVASGPGIVAIGSPAAGVGGFESGEVLLYSGSEFGPAPASTGGVAGFAKAGSSLDAVTTATLVLPSPADGDEVGLGGVAIDRTGSRVVVGAPGYLGTGAILVYEKPGGGWSGAITPTQTLRPPSPAAGADIGASIALTNAGVVIAGAPGTTVDGKAGAGVAYVLRPDGNALAFGETLLPPTPEVNARFGAAVAGQGAEVAIGVPGQTVDGKANAGRVILFREPQQGQALVVRTNPVQAPAPVAGDAFGSAVALDEGRLVVGAPGREGPGATDAGIAYVYDDTPTGDPESIATFADPTPDAGAAFGTAVEVEEGVIAAGAPKDDVGVNEDQGTVALFVPGSAETTISGTLAPSATVFDASGAAGDQYGSAFSIGPEFALAGAPFGGGSAETGEAELYLRTRLFGDAFESTRGGTTACSAPNAAVPDNGTPATSEIVLAASGLASDVDVELHLAHTAVSDLSISLTHVGAARTVVLYAPTLPGQACTSDRIDVALSDQADGGAANATCNALAPAVNGVRIPADWLIQFQGLARAATWRVSVTDRVASNTGTLERWCLTVR